MLNESVSRHLIEARIHQFREICLELGIHTSNKNPVCQRLEAAEKFCSVDKLFDNQNLDLLSKTGEFILLADCLKHLKGRIKSTIHIDKLVSEATYANELAELMTAVLVENAGFPASFEEPDVVVQVGNVEVGLACKKLDSAKKLIERVREARDQIRSSGKPGIIVIDVSKIVEYSSGAVAASEDDAYHALSVGTGKLWKEVASQVVEKIQESSVGSVLFCNFQFYGVQSAIDHEKRIVHYTPFRAAFLDFRSQRNRPAAIETLENAIMGLARKGAALNLKRGTLP